MSKDLKCYEIHEEKDYYLLKINGEPEASQVLEFEKDFSRVLSGVSKHVILQLENLSFLNMRWMRVLLDGQKKLKESDHQIVMVSVPNELKEFLKSEGLDSAFNSYSNIKEAWKALGVCSKRKLDTEFINPFLESTLKVLEIQADTKSHAGKMHIKKVEECNYGDVSGIIGIVSEAFKGSVVISFPEETFLKVMSGMLGEEYTVLSKELLDGAGEITNMIFGQAKIILNQKGYGIKMALPSVISGKNHSLSSLTKGPVLVIPFESTAGNFFVEICISD